MKHRLDGAKFKIVRAKKQLDCLNLEIGSYLDSNPYEFPAEQYGDVVTAKAAIRV